MTNSFFTAFETKAPLFSHDVRWRRERPESKLKDGGGGVQIYRNGEY